MTLVIEHDNGINGQHGASEEEVRDKTEIESIIKDYQSAGITIYKYCICNF